jgi:hypothetical protein
MSYELLATSVDTLHTQVTGLTTGVQEALQRVAALTKVNSTYPMTFVPGQAQYDVKVISGDVNATTAGMALWVEGTIVYAFDVIDMSKFSLQEPENYTAQTQMRLIVNARYDDVFATLDEAYQGEKGVRTQDYYAYLEGLQLETPVAYVAGLSIVRPTQAVTQGGVTYRPKATSLPFTTTNWGVDTVKFTTAEDMTLRQALAAPTGTSLVKHGSRTVEAKLNDTLSPLDKGAVGDGVADDTSAFVAFEAVVRHQNVDLNGRTYKVTAKPTGNRYFNGVFLEGSFKHYVADGQGIVGAARPDYNYGPAVRYNVMSINGDTVSRGAQAFAFEDRTRSMYLMEGGFITRYDMDGPVNAFPLDASGTGETVLGHQGLAVEYLTSGIKLWTTSIVGGRFACRFDYAADVPITQAEVYELFTTGIFANSTSCTPTVSYCGRYLIAHGSRFGTYTGVIRVFEIAKLIAGGPGDYTDKWLYEFETLGLHDSLNPVQGLACDGMSIFVIAGGTGFSSDVYKRLGVYTLDGQLLQKETNFRVGRTLAQADGDGTRYEPEGLAILGGAGGQLTLMSGILSGQPGLRRFRIFGCGMANPIVAQRINLPGNTLGSVASVTSTGREYVSLRASFDLANGAGTNIYGIGDSTQPGGIADFTNSTTRRVTAFNGQTTLKADTAISPLVVDMGGSGQAIQLWRSGTQYGYFNISTSDVTVGALSTADVRVATAGTTRWRFNDTLFYPHVTNTYSIGSASNIVKDITLGVAPIVTSDMRAKQQWRDVSQAERAVAVKAKQLLKFFKLNDAVDLKGDGARWHIGVGAQDLEAAFASEGLNAAEYAMFCHDVWEDQREPVMATRMVTKPMLVEREGFEFLEDVEVEEEYDTGETTLVVAAGDRYAVRYEQLIMFIISALEV